MDAVERADTDTPLVKVMDIVMVTASEELGECEAHADAAPDGDTLPDPHGDAETDAHDDAEAVVASDGDAPPDPHGDAEIDVLCENLADCEWLGELLTVAHAVAWIEAVEQDESDALDDTLPQSVVVTLQHRVAELE